MLLVSRTRRAYIVEGIEIVLAAAIVRSFADPELLIACRKNSLWRGEAVQRIEARWERGDLLDPATYSSEAAAAYFKTVEGALEKKRPRPSIGHIATTEVSVAAAWGRPSTVWPLAKPLRYAWPHAQPFWWDAEIGGADLDTLVHTDLERAFVDGADGLGREVLFEGPFLLVPAHLEPAFRLALYDGDTR